MQIDHVKHTLRKQISQDSKKIIDVVMSKLQEQVIDYLSQNWLQKGYLDDLSKQQYTQVNFIKVSANILLFLSTSDVSSSFIK